MFLKPIALQPEKVESVVLVCVYFHSYLRRNSVSRHAYSPSGSFDSCDADGNFIEGLWRREINERNRLVNLMNVPRKCSADSHKIRDEFRYYFVSPEREVSWQYDAIK